MDVTESIARAGLRLQRGTRTLIQATISIGLAWWLATAVLGFETPFFAPIAAVIVLNSLADRGRRAIEVVIGVAAGIAVGDLVILAIGTGGWQLVLVTVLAMAVVIAAGGGPLVLTQAAVSAVLVATIQPPTVDLIPYRFFHAVIGGLTAFLVAQVIVPLDPLVHLRRAAAPVIDALVDALVGIADAIRHDDLAEGLAALATARRLDERVEAMRTTLSAASETARFAPLRRRKRGQVDAYADAIDQIDLAVRNTRVLARASEALIRHHHAPDVRRSTPPELADAVEDLAGAVRALGDQLMSGGLPESTRLRAAQAAVRTRALFADAHELAISRVIGQIRATGIDLLRCSGMDVEAAQRYLYEARSSGDDLGDDPHGRTG